MENLNISFSEMPLSSLISTSTHSSLPVDHPATANVYFSPTGTKLKHRLDAQIKGLIKCESCYKTFTTRGEYKYISLHLLETSSSLIFSVAAAIAKPILGHTVAITAAKGLH